MLTLVPEEIERYCAESSVPEPEFLRNLARETYEKVAVPQMQVGHLEGALLRLLVRITNARRILEIGTFTGYSALAMAEGLPEDGHLVTCDIDPEATAMARRYWTKSPHGKKIELNLGPALQTLEKLPGSFDMVFLDADKENYVNYWEACVPKVRSGGLLVADNVLWGGHVLAPAHESDHAVASFNQRVRSDPRVEPVMLAIHDGMTLAWKR